MKKMVALILLLALSMPFSLAEEPDNYGNWYEVFVRSYQDSDGDGIGDLQGLISRLDYISDMGYTGLWLMPIMPSPSYHKYDVTDYYNVDTEYGTLEDLKALVEECHARGIKIILDLPINHTSTQHPWFVSACEALRSGDLENPCISYYNLGQKAGAKYAPVEGTDWYYEEQFSGGGMPDLNLESEAVLEEIRAIMDFWLNECGADGFRLDAVTSYFAADTQRNVEFLGWLNGVAKELKPGCYLVGEAWTGLTDIAEYYKSGVDSFFLFPAAQAEGYIARLFRSRNPAADYAKYMNEVLAAIHEGILAPFLANHDTGRAIGSLQARSSLSRAKFAEGVLNMMGGNTFTYYGEEIGMVGSGDDPNKRLAMYWNDGNMTDQPPGTTKVEYAYPCADDQLADENSLLNYCKSLNHLKLQVPAIARGKTTSIEADGNLCIMERSWQEQTIRIVINFSATEAVHYECADDWTAAGTLDASDGKKTALGGDILTLAPYAIVILTKI